MSHSEWQYGPPHESESDALESLLAQALVMPDEHMRWWLGAVGYEHLRVLRHGERLTAGLGIIHAGQSWGGQRVPVGMITAVGVAPEDRGSGVGKRLMSHVLRELHDSRVPISILYPSTLSFYRAVGYERAGTRVFYESPLHAIRGGDRALDIRRVDSHGLDQMYDLHARYAQATPGNLHRPPFVWQAILEAPWHAPRAYLVTHNGDPQGYVVIAQAERQKPLQILDLCALTESAMRRILHFLAGHSTMTETVAWSGTPNDPLILSLPEEWHAIKRSYDWLLRIVDLPRAIESRGYPRSLRLALQLDVRDDLLAENNARWIMEIADGRASIARGGEGRIAIGIRELAAIYTAHLTPAELRLTGGIAGDDHELESLALAFAGPRPRLRDSF